MRERERDYTLSRLIFPESGLSAFTTKYRLTINVALFTFKTMERLQLLNLHHLLDHKHSDFPNHIQMLPTVLGIF